MEEEKLQSVEPGCTRVYDQAVRWLAQRPYSESELATRLERSGFDPEPIAQTLRRCRELGYLNDTTFAQDRAQGRLLRDGWGPWKVRAELAQLGIPEAMIQQALDAILDETPETTLAEKVWQKQFGKEKIPAKGREWQKQQAFLTRRGFGWDVVVRLLGGGDFDS